MDESEYRKNPSKQGALTNWRVWTDRQVRIQKESEQPRGTHFLESTDGWTSQDTERFQVTKGHSPTGEHRQTDKLGHGMNPSDQGALTNWRAQTDRQVRTQKESKQLRGTHILESADGQTSQDRKNPSKQGALTCWRVQMDRQVRT